MTLIAWPTGLVPRSFSLTLATVERAHQAPVGGSEQVVDLLNDRWMASLELAPRRRLDGGYVEGFVAGLRGMTNTVALWHMARPLPRGTMRGAPTVVGTHAQGSSTLALATTAGATLMAGDMLGVSGLLLMVRQACVANGAGAMTVPLANRLRTLVNDGALVTWDRPTAPFRKVNRTGVSYAPGVANAVQIEFVEAVT